MESQTNCHDIKIIEIGQPCSFETVGENTKENIFFSLFIFLNKSFNIYKE